MTNGVLDAAVRQTDVAQRSAIEHLGAGDLPPHRPFAVPFDENREKIARNPCPGSNDLADIVDCVSENTTASIGVDPLDKDRRLHY